METRRAYWRRINFKNGTMKIKESIKDAIIIAIIVVCTVVVKDEISHSKQHQERFDALVRDSVKMHEFYRNVELNYQEKYNLINK